MWLYSDISNKVNSALAMWLFTDRGAARGGQLGIPSWRFGKPYLNLNLQI